MGAGFGFTNHTTPIINIDGRNIDEVEITDEQHPLYGRTFKIAADQDNEYKAKSIRVKYKENIHLTVPITSTNISKLPKRNFMKLTLGTVKDIVLLSEEVNLCPAKNKIFGQKSPTKYKMKS